MEYPLIGFDILRRMIVPVIARANIALTWRCTHRCVMCDIWQSSSQQDQGKELSADEIERIIHANKLMWVSFTGGEPFLNHQIASILKNAAERCRVVSITTNGWLTEKIVNSVAYAVNDTKAVVLVNISLHGDQREHDRRVGVTGAYLNAVSTLHHLRELKSTRLKVGIEYLLNSDNQAFQITKLAKCLGVAITYSLEQSASYYGHDGKENKLALPRREFNLSPLGIFQNWFIRGLERRRKCVALEYSCFIGPYGHVYPCLFFTPTLPLKNLRDEDYKIGKIHKLVEVRNCSGCWTPCETYATMLFRPWRLL